MVTTPKPVARGTGVALLAVGASAAAAAAAAVSNEALAKNTSCVDMPHCHNCRCPEIGQNASNELCKLSAKVGSTHYKRPPCVWVESDSTVTETANKAARFRQTNWGKFVDNDAEWPAQKFNFGEEVKARVLSTDSSMIDVQATIVGCFLTGHDTVSPRTSMYYIRAADGKYYYVSVNDTAKIEVLVPMAFKNTVPAADEHGLSDFQLSPSSKKRGKEIPKSFGAKKRQRTDKPRSGAMNKSTTKATKAACTPAPHQTSLRRHALGVGLNGKGDPYLNAAKHLNTTSV
jgi:hypothetical protein